MSNNLSNIITPKLKCKIEGCNRPRTSKGQGRTKSTCNKHRPKFFNQNRPINKAWLRNFNRNKCGICGWAGPCDMHRLLSGKEGGKYTKDNIKILCPNCHRLVHLDLIKF